MNQSEQGELFSDVPITRRRGQINDFTSELTELCRRHGAWIEGRRIVPMNTAWNAPDAEKWEQYALNEDDYLVLGFGTNR